jgi:hypothetical protein
MIRICAALIRLFPSAIISFWRNRRIGMQAAP